MGTSNTGNNAGAVGENSGCFADATTANAATICASGDALTPNRLLWKSGANYAADTGAAGTQLMINVDFVLATMYQDSWSGSGTRGNAPANYCDKQIHALSSTASISTAVTSNGLNGLTKCTYFFNVAANAGAPAFKITNLDYWKFQLHYVEWSGEDMGGKFLTTNLYTGTVTADQTGIFPTPIRGTYPSSGTAISSIEWPISAEAHANWFPDSIPAGNVGNFVAYANFEGSPFMTTLVTYETGSLLRSIDGTQKAYDSYNSALGTYNTLRQTYNTALVNEKARVGDFFKSIFEAPVKIPARPCPPT